MPCYSAGGGGDRPFSTRGKAARRAAAVESPRSRASSAEINSTSLDSPAGGMARKTTHERYLGRPRSYRSEELTSNGASPGQGAHPKMTNAAFLTPRQNDNSKPSGVPDSTHRQGSL